MFRRIHIQPGVAAVVVSCVVGGYCIASWVLMAYRVAQAARWATADEPHERLADIESLCSTYPRSAALNYWLAVAYRRTGKLDRVAERLSRAGELGWSTQDIARQRRLTEFLLGDFQTSEPFLKELVRSGVSDATAEEVYETLVKGYLTALRVEEARQCLDYWLGWRPYTPRARLWAAEIARVAQDQGAEEAHYRAILEGDPEHFEGHLQLATFLLQAARGEEAEKEYLRCRELRPEHPATLIGLAECLQRMGRAAEAREALEQVLRLPLEDSQRGYALTALGRLLLAERSADRAIDVLREATQISPEDHATWYALGQALSHAGAKEEAVRCLEHSREIAFEAGELQKLYIAVMEKPQDTGLRCQLAATFQKHGKTQLAIAFYRSVLQIDPGNTVALAALASYRRSADGGEVLDGQDDATDGHNAATNEHSFLPKAAARSGVRSPAQAGGAGVSSAGQFADAKLPDR